MDITSMSREEWNQFNSDGSDAVFTKRLSTAAHIKPDAWGREAFQPVSISVRVFLAQPFSQAVAEDQVNHHTVHYGNLSREILSIDAAASEGQPGKAWTIDSYAHEVRQKALVTLLKANNLDILKALEIKITLTKASAAAKGVEWALCVLESNQAPLKFTYLRIPDIQILTVIGINHYEKQMRQKVNLSIRVDNCSSLSRAAPEIEQIAVKTVEETQCGTLEHLIELVAKRVTANWAFRFSPKAILRLEMTKPIAVLAADEVGVSIVRKCDKSLPFGRQLWQEHGETCPAEIPFPMLGRLDDFLRAAHTATKTRT